MRNGWKQAARARCSSQSGRSGYTSSSQVSALLQQYPKYFPERSPSTLKVALPSTRYEAVKLTLKLDGIW